MFYVDNLFACQPLPWVRYPYYIDVNLYHYYLGRADQSVNEAVMMLRIDQQIAVTNLVAECVDVEAVERENPKLGKYMYRNISIMMAISSIHLLLIGTEDAWRKREKLWQDILTSLSVSRGISFYFPLAVSMAVAAANWGLERKKEKKMEKSS